MSIEKKENKIIIISSPSGAGKTTICNYLIRKIKNINLSVSYTTRRKKNNELEGKDYFFVNKEKFNKLKKNKFFIETAIVFNNLYGSPYININKSFKKNKHVLFDIDWQGARKLRKKFKSKEIIDFFILPPNNRELKRRLFKRGRDNKKEINLRLSLALEEMRHYSEYKYVLINNNVKQTVDNLIKIIDYNVLIEKNKTILKKSLKHI
tara:strand:- start:741 stop:1364 length:624 start_codon:yes stop_codon:yes gene_type:complete